MMNEICQEMDTVIMNSVFHKATKQRMLLIRRLVLEDDVLKSIQALTNALRQDGLLDIEEITELQSRNAQAAWDAMPYSQRYMFLRKIVREAQKKNGS